MPRRGRWSFRSTACRRRRGPTPDIRGRQAVLPLNTRRTTPRSPRRIASRSSRTNPPGLRQHMLCASSARLRMSLAGSSRPSRGHTAAGLPRVEAAMPAPPTGCRALRPRAPRARSDRFRPHGAARCPLRPGVCRRPPGTSGEAVPRPAPDRAIVRLRQRIDRGRGSPVIALECRERTGWLSEAGVEYKETGIGTDEVAVTAGIQEGPDWRTQTVVAAKVTATWPSNRTSPSAVQNQTNPRGSLRTHACWSRGRPSAVVKVRTGRRSADSGDTMATATTTMVSAIRKPSRHSLITAGPGCWILGLPGVFGWTR